MTTTAPKRKTTARKPAKARAASVNGNGQPLAPPEKFVPREPVEIPDAPDAPVTAASGVPSHPYGDRQIQVFLPESGEPIVVPHISTIEITEEFLWENHKKNLDLMQQSWRWMDLAGIPDDIQRQVVRLDPAEKRMFWEQWFQGFVPPPAGEPPGES